MKDEFENFTYKQLADACESEMPKVTAALDDFKQKGGSYSDAMRLARKYESKSLSGSAMIEAYIMRIYGKL